MKKEKEKGNKIEKWCSQHKMTKKQSNKCKFIQTYFIFSTYEHTHAHCTDTRIKIKRKKLFNGFVIKCKLNERRKKWLRDIHTHANTSNPDIHKPIHVE